jgi:hypothetical protein
MVSLKKQDCGKITHGQLATWNFWLGGFAKDFKGHVMMQKGQEKPKK